jgi:hypothetical protein
MIDGENGRLHPTALTSNTTMTIVPMTGLKIFRFMSSSLYQQWPPAYPPAVQQVNYQDYTLPTPGEISPIWLVWFSNVGWRDF